MLLGVFEVFNILSRVTIVKNKRHGHDGRKTQFFLFVWFKCGVY